LVLVALLGLGGCGSGKSSGEPAADNGAATAATSAEQSREVIELVFHSHDAATSPCSKFYQEWTDRVNKQAEGKMHITFYPGGVLGAQKDTYDMIKNGTVDLAWCSQNSAQGAFPMTEVFTLPNLGFESATQAGRTLWNLYEQTDYLDEEYAPFKMITLHNSTGIVLSLRDKNKQVNSAADLKGVTIRTSGTWVSQFWTQLGANPSTIPAGEVYSSLEKGVIDGLSGDTHLMQGFGVGGEVIQAVYDYGIYNTPYYVAMNWNSYNNLPEDCKAIIDANSGVGLTDDVSAAFEATEKPVYADIVAHGGEIREASETLIGDMDKVAATLHKQWIEESEAKGYPAQEVYDWVLANMENYK
jgi:TRAP-type C4-dicarboxylate transport system substrate-binding protein